MKSNSLHFNPKLQVVPCIVPVSSDHLFSHCDCQNTYQLVSIAEVDWGCGYLTTEKVQKLLAHFHENKKLHKVIVNKFIQICNYSVFQDL